MSAGPPLPLDRFLWLAANPDAARVRESLLHEARDYARWERLAESAERHGIAPLVDRHLATNADLASLVPSDVRAAIKGLALRHRRANDIRRTLVTELAADAEKHGTPMIFLKGGTLAFTVYEDAGLRAMRDLDVLVRKQDLAAVGAQLRALGYAADDEDTWASDRSHWHHQPSRERVERGFVMSIEVHRQLGIDDPRARRTYAQLEGESVTFDLDGTSVRTLGHADMLRHVYYHGFQTPLEWPDRLRLVSAADVLAFVSAHHARIDWDRLQREAPTLIEGLAWLHTLSPFSEEASSALGLERHARALRVDTDYRGKGRERDRERPDRIAHWRDTLFPPTWWLRVRHGGAPGPLGFARSLARHLREVF